MLMNITLPAGSAAASNPTYNGGSMINKGWEFAISSQNLTGALKWSTVSTSHSTRISWRACL